VGVSIQKALVSGINRLAQEGGTNFVLHPLIHILSSRMDTTTFGDGLEMAKVWIKYEIYSSRKRVGELI
jgi:hypothetical protein